MNLKNPISLRSMDGVICTSRLGRLILRQQLVCGMVGEQWGFVALFRHI